MLQLSATLAATLRDTFCSFERSMLRLGATHFQLFYGSARPLLRLCVTHVFSRSGENRLQKVHFYDPARSQHESRTLARVAGVNILKLISTFRPTDTHLKYGFTNELKSFFYLKCGMKKFKKRVLFCNTWNFLALKTTEKIIFETLFYRNKQKVQ